MNVSAVRGSNISESLYFISLSNNKRKLVWNIHSFSMEADIVRQQFIVRSTPVDRPPKNTASYDVNQRLTEVATRQSVDQTPAWWNDNVETCMYQVETPVHDMNVVVPVVKQWHVRVGEQANLQDQINTFEDNEGNDDDSESCFLMTFIVNKRLTIDDIRRFMIKWRGQVTIESF